MSVQSTTPPISPLPAQVTPAVAGKVALFVAVLGWAYLPMLQVFADKWLHDPQYSHGLLVPFFSAYLMWRARGEAVALKPMPILGFGLLVLILALRAAAGAILFHQLDAAALLLSLVAVSLIIGGLPMLKRTGPAIAFLIFMVPLPYELERNVGGPLKIAATYCSTFLLQTLGLPAIRDGNVILIDEVRLGVVDACSGLKMMVTFAAFSVGAVLLMKRSRFEKLMVLLGIVPVAVLTNVLRITATGVSVAGVSDKHTQEFLHDLYGYMMMLIGLALLALELWVLKRLVLEDDPAEMNPLPAYGLQPALAQSS